LKTRKGQRMSMGAIVESPTRLTTGLHDQPSCQLCLATHCRHAHSASR
jgi:hypothetical protein